MPLFSTGARNALIVVAISLVSACAIADRNGPLPAAIFEAPDSVVVYEGDDLVVTIAASRGPNGWYQWYLDDTVVARTHTPTLSVGDLRFHHEGTLTVRVVDPHRAEPTWPRRDIRVRVVVPTPPIRYTVFAPSDYVPGLVEVAAINESGILAGTMAVGSEQRAFRLSMSPEPRLEISEAPRRVTALSGSGDVGIGRVFNGIADHPAIWRADGREEVVPWVAGMVSPRIVDIDGAGEALIASHGVRPDVWVTRAHAAVRIAINCRSVGMNDAGFIAASHCPTTTVFSPSGPVLPGYDLCGHAVVALAINNRNEVLQVQQRVPSPRTFVVGSAECRDVTAEHGLNPTLLNDRGDLAGVASGRPFVIAEGKAFPVDEAIVDSDRGWQIRDLRQLTNSGLILASASVGNGPVVQVVLVPVR